MMATTIATTTMLPMINPIAMLLSLRGLGRIAANAPGINEGGRYAIAGD
jgi:hypothetical protein